MALKISKKNQTNDSTTNQRSHDRDISGLLEDLKSDDRSLRRWAARDLVDFPQSVDALLAALQNESELEVRGAIFDTLSMIGGDHVVTGLIPFLSSEDAALRNATIEVLQSKPESVAEHIVDLLNDQDSDVRIFAIDILQQLAHPDTPQWLLSVLKDETHINVVATAVDRLAEVGTPEMIPDLEALKSRFPDQPYLFFAVDTAVRRIQEV